MNQIEAKIVQICREITSLRNLMLLDILFRGQKNSLVIEVFVDSEGKLSIDDCASVSKEINSRIEAESLIEGSYRLEVSSPGTDRPLKYLKQYFKHINRNFEISYNDENNINNKIKAKLLRIDGEDLLFMYNNNEIKINFNRITKAKVVISFS
jgi:ribosome maturation factor RimP